ncbi:hypothetical protein [Novosphingobium sp. MMS21-SN21R]|nr:hypothetical protein [Novosphingobium sp. MMS21-SN21R]MDT0507177.1 hypothetical protein [Novosphingobium sp. MMS21-SN21R]
MGIAASSLLTRPYLADEDRATLSLAYRVPYGGILKAWLSFGSLTLE